MKNAIYYTGIVILVWMTSCSAPSGLTKKNTVNYAIRAGVNYGGITENTDMSVVPLARAPEEATVDAFSGATRTGYNAGARVSISVGKVDLESGMDYMYNSQSFYYIDAGNFFLGQRDMDVSQLMLPLSLNVPLFHKIIPEADAWFKIGFIAQYNIVKVMNTGILPDYSLNRWSSGPTAGIAFYPFRFQNQNRLGFYVDVYRGSQIFEDYYNQAEFEMPGSSFVRGGLTFKF